MWGDHHSAYMKDKFDEHQKFRKYVEAVKSEYMDRRPIKSGVSMATARQINLINARDMWSFFWVYRDKGVQNSPGWYAKTLAEAKQELKSKKLTQAQYDIIEYMNERQNEEFNKVAGKTAFT